MLLASGCVCGFFDAGHPSPAPPCEAVDGRGMGVLGPGHTGAPVVVWQGVGFPSVAMLVVAVVPVKAALRAVVVDPASSAVPLETLLLVGMVVHCPVGSCRTSECGSDCQKFHLLLVVCCFLATFLVSKSGTVQSSAGFLWG